LGVGWSNELIGVFAAVAKDVCDLLHPAFFAARTKGDVDVGEPEHHFLEGMSHSAPRRGSFEQTLDEAQMGGAVAICQKPIVADSDEALGQGVEEKAVDKVHRAEGGLFEDVVLPVFVPEADHAVFKANEAAVGDSDAVSVTGQILQDVLSVRDGVPYTDDPVVFVEFTFNLGVGLFKVQVSMLNASPEVIEELAPKDQGEGLLVEQIVLFAWDPAFVLCA